MLLCFKFFLCFLLLADCPKMRQVDINFALTVILHALLPPSKPHSTSKSHHLSVSDIGRSSSISHQIERKITGKEAVLGVAFLGKAIYYHLFYCHIRYLIRLQFGLLISLLYSTAGGHLCYSKFAHLST